MSWYEEEDQKLTMAIARLEATQRRIEHENRFSSVTDDLRRAGLLPATRQPVECHQYADRAVV